MPLAWTVAALSVRCSQHCSLVSFGFPSWVHMLRWNAAFSYHRLVLLSSCDHSICLPQLHSLPILPSPVLPTPPALSFSPLHQNLCDFSSPNVQVPCPLNLTSCTAQIICQFSLKCFHSFSAFPCHWANIKCGYFEIQPRDSFAPLPT